MFLIYLDDLDSSADWKSQHQNTDLPSTCSTSSTRTNLNLMLTKVTGIKPTFNEGIAIDIKG